jgi:hypothetical protein
MIWLPRVLGKLEDKGVMVEEFTAGYLVEAIKPDQQRHSRTDAIKT